MKHLKLTSIILCFCFSQTLWAQKASKVQVINNGQSIEMFISGETDFSFFDQLKVIDNGEEKSFDATQIDGFKFENGRYFLSKKLRGTEERFFFQIPFEGEKSLGVLKSNYYLILGDEAIFLTVESRGNTNTESRELKRKSYLGVLHYAMDDCSPEIVEMINGVNLSYPSLVKLFTSYHSCKGLDYQLHGKTIPFFKPGISAAIGFGSLNQTMDPLEFMDQGVIPTFEVMIDLVFQKFSPRTKVQLGVSYMSLKDQWSSPDFNFNPGNEREWYQEEFNLNIIKLPISYNYNIIHKENQKLYVGAGISYSIVKKESISEISQWEFNSPYIENTIITRPRDPVLLDSKNTYGFLGKVGYKRKVKSTWIFSEIQFDRFSNLGYTVFSDFEIYKYSISLSSLKVGISF
jgi:hypothetical protein